MNLPPPLAPRHPTTAQRLRYAALAALMLAAAAFAEPAPRHDAFHAENVGNAGFGRRLALTDSAGTRRTLAEFRGKVVLLYFGFTYCPDVCPTELARLAELRRRLGPAAERVQVLFVTLDPQRDSAAALRDYVAAFDPGFIGLRGPASAVAVAAREFRVAYQTVRGSAPDRYTIDHSAYVYGIDPAGRLRLRFAPDQSTAQMLDDVRVLLAGR